MRLEYLAFSLKDAQAFVQVNRPGIAGGSNF